MLAAKTAVLTGPVLVAAAIAVLGLGLAGRLILPGHGIGPAHGYPDLSLASGPVLRAAAGSVLYLALIARWANRQRTASRSYYTTYRTNLRQITHKTTSLAIPVFRGCFLVQNSDRP